MKCVINNGRTTDKNMKRKYHTQMTVFEKNLLMNYISKLDDITISDHANDKMDLTQFAKEDFYSFIKEATVNNIIEYNTGSDGHDRRVVLKDHFKYQCDDGQQVYAYFSVSLERQEVVTMWVNEIHDNHSTLNMKIYDKKLKIK